MSDYWHEQTYDFKFQVSDVILLRKNLKILAHACTLDEVLSGRAATPPEDLPREYDGVMIRSCPGTARDHGLERSGGYLAYTMAAYQHCYIDLAGSFNDYQAKFSAKSRSTVTRKIKKFAAHCNGGMRFQCFSKPAEMRAFYESARQVSVLTYQERLLDVGLPATEEFVDSMVEAAQHGRVRAYLLFDGAKPVAYLYCPVTENTLVYAFLGFDPTYRDWSVGTILLWLSLESIFSEKLFAHLDFTEGSSSQKVLFSTHQVPCHNRLLLRDSLANRALVRTHRRFDQASRALGRMTDRVGLKPAIKRLLRGT
ncbi:MAG TPA: GNAT family N-acetyltransferase [Candidatus Deferrimicrobiaceae bacterium]|nr:GNAT family N-acetyltransferase [Candidatus Deferrimicrobiaceae bacterium]